MSSSPGWSRIQLLLAFKLYCQMPFGKMHSRNPEIIKYAALINRTPSALAMKMSNIASLDPAITSTGRIGLAGASLADKAMWEEMQSDWNSFVIEMELVTNSLEGVIKEPIKADDDTDASGEEIDYTGNSKTVQTTARIGQDFFRRSVLSAYDYRCCITGLSVPKLLIASHIVPWRIDVSNRLNPKNGLCLSMLHDKAFDAGIITVTEKMTVKVSRKYINNTDNFFAITLLAYEDKPIALPEKFSPHVDFLAYHYENIFSS